ncbi:hypothetical protein GGR59_000240 [Xanthomonas arboricola]|nr:hypothetical protein [Xanthomonas arboricola]
MGEARATTYRISGPAKAAQPYNYLNRPVQIA